MGTAPQASETARPAKGTSQGPSGSARPAQGMPSRDTPAKGRMAVRQRTPREADSESTPGKGGKGEGPLLHRTDTPSVQDPLRTPHFPVPAQRRPEHTGPCADSSGGRGDTLLTSLTGTWPRFKNLR